MRKKVKIEDPQAVAERAVQIFLLVLFLTLVLKTVLFPYIGIVDVNIKEIKENNALHE